MDCQECGRTFKVIPARVKTAKFCSVSCKSSYQSRSLSGENSPFWTGGEREKVCEWCGNRYKIRHKQPITTFKQQKFCSKACADLGGVRHFGPDNHKWTGSPRRKHRESKQASWARAVMGRDHATCRRCGATGVELHAHHIVPYKDAPSQRWDVANGLTLCFSCHWLEHTVTDANGVNSGKPAADNAGGNPEPSQSPKVLEGVTARGRAYRRVDTTCAWCGVFISKRFSDAVGKSALFCSLSCSSKHKASNISAETRLKMSRAQAGQKRGPHSEETKRKIAEGNRRPKPRKASTFPGQ
jgi:hypothetical protein